MNCPACSAELIDGARFCGVCGHRLEGESGQVRSAPAAGPAAPTLAPDPGRLASGKRGGIPKAPEPAPAPKPLPYLDGDPYVNKPLNKRFHVKDKLGEGGFGAVYRGVQTGTGREVALKMLHPEMTRDKNVLARFRREGEVLCSLKDAHTITTYDFDQTEDGTLFIAMELLSGRSLHEVFQDEAPIDWKRMLRLVSQMCSSLLEAHQMGIVHRDLKPENIYLESRPGHPEFVKILDFGIAKVVRGDGVGGNKQAPQLTATGQTLGTLEYMSPEQLMGKELDGTSDIYAVGVLSFEMITGQLPFPDAVGPAALISAQLKQVPPPASSVVPGIPPEVDELILRCLGKHKTDRFADAAELRAACEEVLAAFERPATAEPVLRAATSQPDELDDASENHRGGPVAWGHVPSASTEFVPAARGSDSRLWLWVLIVVAIAGGAVGAFFALK